MAYCSTPAEGLQSLGCSAKKIPYFDVVFMAEVEQLNYKGAGIGDVNWHKRMNASISDVKKSFQPLNLLVVFMISQHQLYYTLQPQKTAWNRNLNSKLPFFLPTPMHLCASVHLQIPIRARIRNQKVFDCKEEVCACALPYFTHFVMRAPRSPWISEFTTHHIM